MIRLCVFSTGMFSYTMLSTSPLFCYPDWPRRFFGRFPEFLQPVLPLISPPPGPSTSCVYLNPPSDSGRQDGRDESQTVSKPSTPGWKHKLGAIFTLVYIAEQLFLPYSHFITQVIVNSSRRLSGSYFSHVMVTAGHFGKWRYTWSGNKHENTCSPFRE